MITPLDNNYPVWLNSVYHVTFTSQMLRRTAIFYFGLEVKTKVTFYFFIIFNETWRSLRRLQSPVSVVQRSLISSLVSSNTSTNLFSKCIKIADNRSIIKWILRTGSSKCLKKLDHQSNSCKKKRR